MEGRDRRGRRVGGKMGLTEMGINRFHIRIAENGGNSGGGRKLEVVDSDRAMWCGGWVGG